MKSLSCHSRLAQCVFLTAVGVGLVGCGTSSKKLNQIQPGMGRAQVEKILGRPSHTAAQGDTVFLGYNLNHAGMSERREFSVKLVEGRVEAFGEKSDFGAGRLTPPVPPMAPAPVVAPAPLVRPASTNAPVAKP